uniref:Fork-head domain-containing protein n=1 Tax=Rhinopithecus roxellana TaxID=61622 RepID=A0A2K6RGT5_RHIRO
MGPVMPPSKKPESSGISVSSGLSQCYQGSGFSKALQEEDDLDFSLPDIRLEEGAMEDEELTNLNWLHESKNLLKSFGESVLRSVSPVQDLDDDTSPVPRPLLHALRCQAEPQLQTPYSFSCLIFMAMEDSPTERLPVKDIYNWILEHFLYFANAPTGWKNSVRHNLSLNKCFKKVDKERSQSIGKGSFTKSNSGFEKDTLSPTPTPLLQDPDIDAAMRVLSPGLFPGVRPLPITPIGVTAAMRNGITGCRMRTESQSSSAKSSNARSTSPTSHSISSSSSSADNHYEFATKGTQEGSEGSKGSFRNHESPSNTEEDDRKHSQKEAKDSLGNSGYASQHKKCQRFAEVRKVPSDTLPLKKTRTEKPSESDDEEMKEAAGSLLHLAGIRSCLNNITNRMAKGQKEQKETTKN